MIQPFVLESLKEELKRSDEPFTIIDQLNTVIHNVYGYGKERRESFLKGYRKQFYTDLDSQENPQKLYACEAALQLLVKYWDDAYARIRYIKLLSKEEDCDYEEDDKDMVHSLTYTYYHEVENYIAIAYCLFLTIPSDEYFDLEEKYHDIDRKRIYTIISESGGLTINRIEKLEYERRVKAGKEIEPVKYSTIPTSGIDLVDRLPEMLTNKSLKSVKVRMNYWRQFQKICTSKSTDKTISQEEKEIWVRNVINCLDAVNKVSDAEGSFGLRNLSAEFIGILESAFMQSPNPICVKRLAMEIGAMYYFDQMVLVPGENETDSAQIDYFSEVELEQIMGNARAFYEKKLCLGCDVKHCPYDIYYRMYQMEGEDNEKYSSASSVEKPSEEKPIATSSVVVESESEAICNGIILSTTMKDYLDKAKDYFKNDRWHNTDKLEYAIFMKAFYKKLFRKEGTFNTYWNKLPIFRLQDGKEMSSKDFIDAMRKYSAESHDGIMKKFEDLLSS